MRADVADVVDALRDLPGLADCSATELRQLAGTGRAVRLPADWTVVQERTPGDCCYLVLDGLVEVTVAGERVAELGPGTVFGEVALLSARLRNASVTTRTPARLLVLAAAELQSLLSRQPHLADVLLADYRRRAGVTL